MTNETNDNVIAVFKAATLPVSVHNQPFKRHSNGVGPGLHDGWVITQNACELDSKTLQICNTMAQLVTCFLLSLVEKCRVYMYTAQLQLLQSIQYKLNFDVCFVAWDFQQCGIYMCDQQSLRSASAYAHSDQSLCLSLECSMSVKLLTEHLLKGLRSKGGCTGSSQSTLVKMSNCLKSHAMAHISFFLLIATIDTP